jgi:hypothetical protein
MKCFAERDELWVRPPPQFHQFAPVLSLVLHQVMDGPFGGDRIVFDPTGASPLVQGHVGKVSKPAYNWLFREQEEDRREPGCCRHAALHRGEGEEYGAKGEPQPGTLTAGRGPRYGQHRVLPIQSCKAYFQSCCRRSTSLQLRDGNKLRRKSPTQLASSIPTTT